MDFAQIAAGAQQILDRCQNQLGKLYTGGEINVLEPYKWRVVVRSDQFCKASM